MKIIIKYFSIAAIVSAIQCLIVPLIWDAGRYLYTILGYPIRYDLYWGRTLWIAYGYVFLPVILSGNLAGVSIGNKSGRWFAYAIGIAAMTCYWSGVFGAHPYRTAFVYAIFVAVYAMGVIACRAAKTKITTRTV